MGVTFSVRGLDHGFEVGDESWMNLSSVNARELLRALDLESADLCGSIRSLELALRIANARKTPDVGRPDRVVTNKVGAQFIEFGREPGRMVQYYDALQKICELAGALGVVAWG